MISVDAWTTIRYLKAQGKGIKAIARELGVSRNTVRRALRRNRIPKYQREPMVNQQLEVFAEFIRECHWGKRFIGSRILEELRKRGYGGSQAAFYRYLARLKAEQPQGRAFLRYETAPGQQAQFDWSTYTLDLGGALTRVVLFGLILSYSRRKHYHPSLDETQGSIYEALEEGFWHFGGAARQLLVDNARSFVLQARPGHFQWNPHFLELCGHYSIQPIASCVGRPQGKGKIEEPFYFLEEHFLKGGQWRDFAHFCQELARFEAEELDGRIHQTTQERPLERFQREAPYLLPLPETRFVGSHEELRKVNWDCLFSFRHNQYGVPPAYAGKRVWVRVSQGHTLQVYNLKGDAIASYTLARGKGAILFKEEHYAQLRKRAPRTWAVLRAAFLEQFPGYEGFLEKLYAQRRLNPEAHLRGILELAHLYPAQALREAFSLAERYNTFSHSFIRGLVERRGPREEPLPPAPSSLRALPVLPVPGDLSVYQGLLLALEDPEPMEGGGPNGTSG